MIELKVLILNSLFCYGVYVSFAPDMILSPIRNIYEKVFKVWDEDGELNNKFFYYLAKPLFACTVCMASVWGIVFVYFSKMTLYSVMSVEFLIHICIVAGLNYLIAEIIDSLKSF